MQIIKNQLFRQWLGWNVYKNMSGDKILWLRLGRPFNCAIYLRLWGL